MEQCSCDHLCSLLYFSYLFLAALLPCRKSLLLWGQLWPPPPHMVVDRHGYHPSPGVKVWPGIHGCTRYLTPELSGHQRQPGKERGRDGKRLLPLGAVVLIPSLPVSPTLCDTTDLPLEDTLVVKVLDKNPSCPCCGNQTGWILGLTEHLKS